MRFGRWRSAGTAPPCAPPAPRLQFHALRTRQAGRRAFISLHVLAPQAWTVQRGHDELERVEGAVLEALPYATVFTHLEPIEDPRSYDDTRLDREHQAPAAG
jgi:divalent metal cation (Fe/Co/Zn/Cd) transporter